MRDEYDFSEATENPYAERLRKPVTIRLDIEAIDYFKQESVRTGIPYQNLINLYLLQCAREEQHLTFS